MHLVVLALTLVACGETARSDLRFHTPKATVDTLLESYGLERVSQSEIRRRMSIGRTFHLVDKQARDACFSTVVTPADEGLVGYVFGSLAPTREDMRITITPDIAHIFGKTLQGRRNTPVVLHPDGEGNWRISLEESVPATIRRHLDECPPSPEHSRVEQCGATWNNAFPNNSKKFHEAYRLHRANP